MISVSYFNVGRSQWPRSLRKEMSSLARTLGSWDQIALKAWMFAFTVSLCCSVQAAASLRADPPSTESYRLSKINNLK
jgi:hypothetical protein